jgi:hypothetical protein
MRRLPGSIALAVYVVLTTGCINSTALIKVKPDGSGTVEQTLLMNVQALETMAKTMGAAMGTKEGEAKPGEKPSFKDVFKEAELKKMGENLGPGVRLVSVTPLSEGGLEGARLLFAFDDINKIGLDPANLGGSGMGEKRDYVFALTRLPNGASRLVINAPPDEDEEEAEDEEDEEDEAEDEADEEEAEDDEDMKPEDVSPEMQAMVKQMFAGMRFSMDIEVEGTIVSTSSDYVSGRRVTILEVDFDQLLQQEAALKQLPKLGPNTNPAEAMAALKGIKGLKMSPPPVTIEFK